ncbi:MAG: hypothetical protein PHE02_05610 [Lachnospiraceae bacterium]|nr:hypothetical protein [Lachnospiraceae bacterium]
MVKKLFTGAITFAISLIFIWLDLAIASVVHNLISHVSTPTVIGYLLGAVLSFFSTPAVATYIFKDKVTRADALCMCGYIGVILMSLHSLICLPLHQYLTAFYDVIFAIMYLCILKFTENGKLV